MTRKKSKENSVLDAAAIVGADDIKTERVKVPEWSGDVFVRTMSASDRDQWELAVAEGEKDGGLKDLSASFLVLCLCDGDGALLFKSDDAARLGAKSSRAVNRLWRVARRLNGIGDEAIAELEKN